MYNFPCFSNSSQAIPEAIFWVQQKLNNILLQSMLQYVYLDFEAYLSSHPICYYCTKMLMIFFKILKSEANKSLSTHKKYKLPRVMLSVICVFP